MTTRLVHLCRVLAILDPADDLQETATSAAAYKFEGSRPLPDDWTPWGASSELTSNLDVAAKSTGASSRLGVAPFSGSSGSVGSYGDSGLELEHGTFAGRASEKLSAQGSEENAHGSGELAGSTAAVAVHSDQGSTAFQRQMEDTCMMVLREPELLLLSPAEVISRVLDMKVT